MTQTTVPSIAVQTETRDFERGFTAGYTGTFRDHDRPWHDVTWPITETDIVDIMRNVSELYAENNLTDAAYEECLRFSCGLIAGWVSRPASEASHEQN